MSIKRSGNVYIEGNVRGRSAIKRTLPNADGFDRRVDIVDAILSLDPIGYWILNEKSGTVAYNWASHGQAASRNGVHVGVTLGQPGGGDGRTAPFYDGINDYTDVFTASLAADFNGVAGAASALVRAANVGVWTDGVERWIFRYRVDNNNRVDVYKSAANDTLIWLYRAGGVNSIIVDATVGTIVLDDWFQVGITWDATIAPTGEMRAVLNGAQVGATQVGLGAWVGNITQAETGAASLVPISVWHGYEYHPLCVDHALPIDEFNSLYRVFRGR